VDLINNIKSTTCDCCGFKVSLGKIIDIENNEKE
jgi:hypothetical protein